MTMWWQQNTCFGVFNDSAGRAINSYISACFILLISFLFTHPVGRAQGQKAVEHFISWGVMRANREHTFSATADGILHN